MKTLFFVTFISLIFASDTIEYSMFGMKINDSINKLDSIKLKVVASDLTNKTPTIKYTTENGNNLSVTTSKEKIVYLENDWLQDVKGNKPLITNFTFGETSLKDIRTAFGTNGFTHSKMSFSKTKTHLIMFNCFEIESSNNEILVTITKISLNANVTETNIAELAKLDALILCNAKYLDKIWGKNKNYDANFKKITF